MVMVTSFNATTHSHFSLSFFCASHLHCFVVFRAVDILGPKKRIQRSFLLFQHIIDFSLSLNEKYSDKWGHQAKRVKTQEQSLLEIQRRLAVCQCTVVSFDLYFIDNSSTWQVFLCKKKKKKCMFLKPQRITLAAIN